MLARDARNCDPGALPDVVVVDLGDCRADSVLELRLRRAEVVALLLERMRVREVELTGEYADEAARHTLIQAESARSTIEAASRTTAISRGLVSASRDSSRSSRRSRPRSRSRLP